MIIEDTAKPEKAVKVRVSDRWRVVNPVDGTAHIKGDTLTVPEEWERNRWVERVSSKS
jgi:hypothetical protein